MLRHRVALGAAFIVALAVSSAPGEDQTLGDLKARADAVLRQDIVSSRAHIEVVMELAGRLAEAGQNKEAAKYYEAGLKRYPLDLRHQLALAEVLTKLGRAAEAAERARIVARTAEDDALVIQAMKMLGQEVDTTIEPVEKPPSGSPAVVLVPMGEVDVLLLREVRQRVEDQLGIPVMIRSVPLTLPPPQRDPLHEACRELRSRFMEMKETRPKEFSTMLEQAGLREADLEGDEQVIVLYDSWLDEHSGEQARRRFAEMIDRLRARDKQWHVNVLMDLLWDATKPYRRGQVRFVGVTRLDIYGDNARYLFASSRLGRVSVMSYRRFMSDFWDESPSRARLLKRTTTQALSCTAKVFGIKSCLDPTCPLAYPNSVAEQDAKGDTLCDSCRRAFDKAVGRKPAASGGQPASTPTSQAVEP